MKKALKVIAILILVCIVLIAGCAGLLFYQQSKYSSTAVPYIKKAVPDLAEWNSAITKSYFSELAIKKTSDAKLERYNRFFSKLGALKSMEEPIFNKVFTGNTAETGFIKTVTYTIVGHFDAGDGLMTIVLLDEGENKFSILSYHINSEALID